MMVSYAKEPQIRAAMNASERERRKAAHNSAKPQAGCVMNGKQALSCPKRGALLG
jgi:hypothetical protein